MPRPPSSPLARRLDALLRGAPSRRAALARAVADEDVPSLCQLLAALGLDGAPARAEALLAAPGPFTPAWEGWT